jgi:hypothetical protein
VVHARTIVGHGIVGAWDVEHEGEVTVVALMEGREPEKVGAGAIGGK